ncbi:hypothetical protein Hanom_Chr08g00725551 [Helianthus anomalus]
MDSAMSFIGLKLSSSFKQNGHIKEARIGVAVNVCNCEIPSSFTFATSIKCKGIA